MNFGKKDSNVLLCRLLMICMTGSVTYGADYIEDLELWRQAARIAGRRFGSQVRTGVSRDGTKVWASEGR